MLSSTAVLSASSFINNLKTIKSTLKHSKFCLPVKANAYGHGVAEVIRLSSSIVDYYAVADVREANEIFKYCSNKPILIFGAVDPDSLAKNHKESFVYSIQSLDDFSRIQSKNLNFDINVHVKVNTGMNRLGLDYDDFLKNVEAVCSFTKVNVVGMYSHLACADNPSDVQNQLQIERFRYAVRKIKEIKSTVICHLANSYGLASRGDIVFDMVRPGIMSYGYLPSFEVRLPFKKILPCLELLSTVVHLVKLKEGFENAGYSLKHRGKKGEELAIVPIGYGDGIPKLFEDKLLVKISNKFFRVVCVNMDSIIVSIGHDSGVKIGDVVEVISRNVNDPNSVRSLSTLSGLITYEVTTNISNRVVRNSA